MIDALAQLFEWIRGLEELPFLVLLGFATPLAALAFFRKVYPTPMLALLAAGPFAASFALLVWPQGMALVAALDLVLFFVAVIDLFLVPPAETFVPERLVGRIASLKKNHPVALTIVNQSLADYAITVRDGSAQEFVATPDQFALKLDARSRATLHYDLKATRRGAFAFDTVYLRVGSGLGLWQAYYEYPVKSEIHVYPDMKQLSEYAILARTNRLSLLGVRRTRKIGQDNEFERLRDYTLDDNYKHIDWRTTARRSKLTVKDFQTSQSQRLIFLVDAGRMMTNEAGGISLLDHALNAMLMLSYVALRQGDSVGAIFFADGIQSFCPPRGGDSQMNRLLHASYDLFPQLVESRYDNAFFYLSKHCRKRSLVCLITNVIDEVNAHQVEQYLTNLVGQHLPLAILLRDHRLFDAVEPPLAAAAATGPPVYLGPDLYRAAAAASILSWRQQVLRDLIHKGVLALDVFPENLTAPLVNSYLDIKARHLL